MKGEEGKGMEGEGRGDRWIREKETEGQREG